MLFIIVLLLSLLIINESYIINSSTKFSISRALSRSLKTSPANIITNTKLYAKPKHKVTIQHDGKETTLDVSEDCSVLDAAIDAGIELPHDCKLGVCLTCPSKIVSGKVDDTGSTLDDSVKEAGFALTCCTYPRSDMVIRSVEEDELVSAQFSR